MKFVLIMLLITSCGYLDRGCTHWTGSLTYKCSESGVQYVQSDSGLALHVDVDNNPVRCQK